MSPSEPHVKMRTESDSMGTIEVPANVYWGAQTQRSLLHFDIGRDTMPPELIRAFGILKKACALVNQDLGKLASEKARLIEQAADEVISGKIGRPISSARLANRKRHADEHERERSNFESRHRNLRRRDGFEETLSIRTIDVNMSQSSNDTFPAAMHISRGAARSQRFNSRCHRSSKSNFRERLRNSKDVVKIGRTHLAGCCAADAGPGNGRLGINAGT